MSFRTKMDTFALRTKKSKNGQEAGTITTDPEEIDDITRGRWGPVYEGNVKGDPIAFATIFLLIFPVQFL